MFKIAVLASTKGTDLQAIIDEMKAGKMPGIELSVVISNKEDCYNLLHVQTLEMLPLQPPSANPLETAKGLMRCLQLYSTVMNRTDLACGLHDWKNKNKGDREEFIKSKQFKTCGDYEAYKLRNEYAFKFMQIAHLIALEEGFSEEILYLHNDKQFDTYFAMILEFSKSDKFGDESNLSDEEKEKEIKNLPIPAADISICMDYRDYIDSIYKK